MYETYYGFSEKPFSLTPDPKYLYRSQSHGNAFDLLQYAIRRREGFVVVTGDIGTGKTTLCRALLEQIDRTTFTALVLNPFLTEEDLLKRILQDFGVISREELKSGRLSGVSKQELIDALYDFLLGLIPLNASAVNVLRSICSSKARHTVVLPVPMSPVTTMKPSRRRMAYCSRSNASPCDCPRYRNFGSGVRLKGFSTNP